MRPCFYRGVISSIVTFTLMTYSASPAMAAGSGGTVALTIVDAENGGIYLAGTGMLNPDSCTSNTHAVIPGANSQQKEFLAIALTAMASGKHVALWFSGCSATPWSSSEPVVVAISLVP